LENKRKKILSVSELTGEIKNTLEENFNLVWVSGEISNLRTPSSGHMYFTLKDQKSQIRVVIFRSKARYLPKIEDGLQILLKGSIGVYEARGEYQVIGEYLELSGVGNLQITFDALKEKLYKEGLFDTAHKKPLPPFPKTVGIITSSTGAAIKDVLHVASRRYPVAKITIYPAIVQGDAAAGEIASGIAFFNEIEHQPDVILITRGGGSLEDLWAFNSESLARVIFESEIPVVSAVGHEIDFTISDFTADVRAPTPSAAAEIIFPDIEVIRSTVSSLKKRLLNEHQTITENGRLVHTALQRQLMLLQPQKEVNNYAQRVDDLNTMLVNNFRVNYENHLKRLSAAKRSLLLCAPNVQERREHLKRLQRDAERSIIKTLHDKKIKLANVSALLRSSNPDNVLKKGYAICRKAPKGEVVTKSSSLASGDKVHIQLADGSVKCNVEESV